MRSMNRRTHRQAATEIVGADEDDDAGDDFAFGNPVICLTPIRSPELGAGGIAVVYASF